MWKPVYVNFIDLIIESLSSILSMVNLFYLKFSEWTEEKLPDINILRLIYQGRFLHGNVTLGGELIV